MKQFIISIIILLGVLGLMLSGSGIMSDKADAESARILEDAIRRATVQCYALEGAYPQSVESSVNSTSDPRFTLLPAITLLVIEPPHLW